MTPAAQQALRQLKTAFTMASILNHPDPSKPFVVEVDASETGVGAILSERFGEKPCCLLLKEVIIHQMLL